MLTVYSMLTILCNRVNKSPLCVLELMKTKGKNTHPTPSPYKQQPQKDKEIKKKKLKTFCPSQRFCSIHCGWPYSWSYSLITAGTSLPASISILFLCVHCTCVPSTWLGDYPQVPAQPHTACSGSGHSRNEDWDVSPFSAG